jgi:hypothetical protein
MRYKGKAGVLWELCKEIVRNRYRNDDGTWNCYTCGSVIDSPEKAQTAHFIPASVGGASLRFDLRNLRICDYRCNINLGGNQSAYYHRLRTEVGQEEIDELFRLKNLIIKADEMFYARKIKEYTEIRDMEANSRSRELLRGIKSRSSKVARTKNKSRDEEAGNNTNTTDS